MLVLISATTGGPLLINPHRYGEAILKAVVLVLLTGLMLFGMPAIDRLLYV